MTANNNNSKVSDLKTELDKALSALDLALLEAGRSVSIVRHSMTRVFELAENAEEMKAAIVRAREQLALTFQSDSAAPELRAVPTQEEQVSDSEPVQEPEDDATAKVIEEPEAQPQPEPAAGPATNAEQVSDSEPVQEPEDDAVKDVVENVRAQLPAPPVERAERATHVTRCLRLKASKKSGSLDLKDVDRAVNENSAVMDVALLDYDGRQATLKLWVNERADPIGVREALLTSLRAHLGEEETELAIDFEEDSAA